MFGIQHIRHVIIVDDNPKRSRLIASTVNQLGGDAYSVHAPKTLSALLHLVREGKPCMLFISARATWADTDGISLANQLSQTSSDIKIAFIDGEPTAAYEVYKVPHVIMLPSMPSKFDVAHALEAAENELRNLEEQPFLVKDGASDRVLSPQSVCFIESDKRVLYFHVGNSVVRTYGKLSEVMELMPHSFFQCHKSFLINLRFIAQLNRDHAVLLNGSKVPVSQKRRKATREALRVYLGRAF